MSVLQKFFNQNNPVQVLISMAWMTKTEVKNTLKELGIKPTAGDQNLATLRIAFRNFVYKSGDQVQMATMTQGWVFDADLALVMGNYKTYEEFNDSPFARKNW